MYVAMVRVARVAWPFGDRARLNSWLRRAERPRDPRNPTMYAPRREHLRIPTDVEVSLGSDHNFFVGWSENISEGGLFLATHQLVAVGTIMEVTLKAEPHLPKTTVEVEVRWLRKTNELTSDCPPGMGMKFVNLPPEVAEGIHAFVATRRDAMFVDMEVE